MNGRQSSDPIAPDNNLGVRNAESGEDEARADVVGFEVRILGQNLGLGHSRVDEPDDIANPQTRAADAGAAAASPRVLSDSLEKVVAVERHDPE